MKIDRENTNPHSGDDNEQFEKKEFGVALRDARRACARKFPSPIYWGSTILIGDPRVTLKPTRKSADLSEELLDAFFLNPTGGGEGG